jgi:hypothetical protein
LLKLISSPNSNYKQKVIHAKLNIKNHTLALQAS